MKQYKKPLMKIVELEKVDVLTCSQNVNCTKYETHTECLTNRDCACFSDSSEAS